MGGRLIEVVGLIFIIKEREKEHQCTTH
jgi:hypothetical protein